MAHDARRAGMEVLRNAGHVVWVAGVGEPEFSRNQMIQREYLAKTSPMGSSMIQGRAAYLTVMPRSSGARVGLESGAIMSVAPSAGSRNVSGLFFASCDSQAQSFESCSDPPDSCSVWQQPAASFTCSAFALQQQSGIATRSERKAEKMTLKGLKTSLYYF